MKRLLIALGAFVALSASAETIKYVCAIRTYDCYPTQDGSQKCRWGSDMGNLYDLEIQKTGGGPAFEIWEGSRSGMVRGKYPYTLSLYQRREANHNFNYLKVQIKVDGVTVISDGQNLAEARYFREADTFGIGIHCSTDIAQAP